MKAEFGSAPPKYTKLMHLKMPCDHCQPAAYVLVPLPGLAQRTVYSRQLVLNGDLFLFFHHHPYLQRVSDNFIISLITGR